MAQKCVVDICRFLHSPLNDVIMKMAIHHLDLLLNVKNWGENIYEKVRASAKLGVRHL